MGCSTRVLLLPGWLNSGPEHWQSRWELLHGFERVEQSDWHWPRRGDWMARLEEVLLSTATPAVLVAHSLGCHLVAAWAAHSAHSARVLGALLVAPPDLQREDMPPQITGWRPIVRRPLPFQSLLVYSDDDPFCTDDRAHGMASDWGSERQGLRGAGHVNDDSGLSDWPAGRAWLSRWDV